MKHLAPVMYYLLPVPVLFLSLFIGPSGGVAPGEVLHVLGHRLTLSALPGSGTLDMAAEVLFNIRLPRICLDFLVGGALAASGTALQAMVRNPLVSPDILGLSSGAAFGAALAMTVGWLPLQPSAFVFGLLAAALSYLLAVNRRGLSIVSLVLAGIIIGGMFTALLTIVQIVNDPFKLQTIVHWTMGDLHNASWQKVRSALAPICAGMVVLFAMRWRMNVLALGDEETRTVGLNPEREKLLLLIPATLAASAAVAVAGIIGMVGLVVPHMVRMLVGPDNTRTLPVSCAFGGTFLVLVDDLARAITTFEVPVGIFTTLIGGPFFIYLLKKSGAGFGE
jgi:iron complex transport system permease protein